MGYRGEDVSTTHGAWGRQTPWQSSSDDYQAADNGAGYGPGDGYQGQGQPGYGDYGQQDQQYDGYGQQPQANPYGHPYAQYEGYEPAAGDPAGAWGTTVDGWRGTASGYGGQQEYGQGDYGYERGGATGGYPQGGGYDPAPAPGYRPDSGYQGPSGGGYQGQNDGYGQSGGYQAQHTGGFQVQRTGGQPVARTGGHPALPGGSGGYPAQDAGNDWYGGQAAASSGGSFADTGSYRFNGQATGEYGTGPRGALRDPGYPPSPQLERGLGG
jgi:hypothetical protein